MNYQKLVRMMDEGLFIIGEAGVNHNGDLEIAKGLVDVAKAAGCDAVKFQTWITEKVYSRALSLKPEYQMRTTDRAESEFDTIKKLELSFDAFRELKKYCDHREIVFFSTPDERESVDFLIDIGAPLLKTASQDVTNLPFLRHVAKAGLPLIVSTGACRLSEIAEAIETISSENQDLVILHCLSAYPAPLEDLNLNVIPVLRQMFGYPVGFSDHTTGTAAACAAVALGARIFEKHFTYNRSASGPDHQASLSPAELKEYVDTLRAVHSSLGDGHKRVMSSEENTRKAFRRFLVTARPIRKGARFEESDFVFKKTGSGLSPAVLERFVGEKAARDIPEDALMDWDFVEFGAPR
ncbi:MAG: N,N-diacetyllegionaminic acid synthase [Gemmatimonadetes bacterium]|nr:N,N-diacetyllegionaminic acid synthase [Gemmatimonadota bacterium]